MITCHDKDTEAHLHVITMPPYKHTHTHTHIQIINSSAQGLTSKAISAKTQKAFYNHGNSSSCRYSGHIQRGCLCLPKFRKKEAKTPPSASLELRWSRWTGTFSRPLHTISSKTACQRQPGSDTFKQSRERERWRWNWFLVFLSSPNSIPHQ